MDSSSLPQEPPHAAAARPPGMKRNRQPAPWYAAMRTLVAREGPLPSEAELREVIRAHGNDSCTLSFAQSYVQERFKALCQKRRAAAAALNTSPALPAPLGDALPVAVEGFMGVCHFPGAPPASPFACGFFEARVLEGHLVFMGPHATSAAAAAGFQDYARRVHANAPVVQQALRIVEAQQKQMRLLMMGNPATPGVPLPTAPGLASGGAFVRATSPPVSDTPAALAMRSGGVAFVAALAGSASRA